MSTDARARIIIEAITREAATDLQRVGQELQKISGAGENAGRAAKELADQYRAMGRAATAAAIDAAAVGDKKHAADLAKQAAEANKLATQYDKLAASSQRSGKTIGQTLGEIRTATVIAMAAVVGAVRLADKAYDASVGELMRLASEVRKLSTITGQSAEDTSRLVQVFADFNIESSQVTAAMRIMRSQGLVPTMASIAQLSDRYLALAPGIERVNFLQTTFGRGGAEFALVLEQGSAALRARAATIENGLVLTQAQLDQTEELRQAQDDLGDSGKSLAVAIGVRLVPAVLMITRTIVNALTPTRELIAQWLLLNRATADSATTYRAYVTQAVALAIANGRIAESAREFYIQGALGNTLTQIQAQTLGIYTKAQWEHIRATDAATAAQREDREALMATGVAIQGVAEAEARLAAMQLEASTSMQGLADTAAAMWGGAESSIDSFITSSADAIDFMLTRGPEWLAAGRTIRNAIMSNAITPEDGRIYFQGMDIARQAMMTTLGSRGEWTAAQAVATEWGIPFWKALQDIRAARLEAENFPRNIETIINFRTVGAWTTQERLTGVSGQGGGGGGGSYSAASVAAANLAATRESYGGAAGGPIHPITEVGELGTEGIINGMIIPHGEWTAMKRAGLIPTRHAQGGDDYFLRHRTATGKPTLRSAMSVLGWGATTRGGTKTTGGGEIATTATATAAAVAEATAPIAEAVGALVAAMPTAEAISQSSTAAARTQAAALIASNRELAALLQAILMGQGRLATDGGVGRAVRDNVQAGG